MKLSYSEEQNDKQFKDKIFFSDLKANFKKKGFEKHTQPEYTG